MTIIGIDLGTTTGWALLDNEGNRLDSGYWDLPAGERKPAHARFSKLNQNLNSLFITAWRHSKEEKIHLGYERPTWFGNLAPALVYGGFESILLVRCEAEDIDYHPIPVSHVKTAAIGRGRVKPLFDEHGEPVKHDPKRGMAEAAHARWPWTGSSGGTKLFYQSDEVDALWTAEACRLAIQGGTLPWDNVPPKADGARKPRKAKAYDPNGDMELAMRKARLL